MLLSVLIALVVIMATARITGAAFAQVSLPAVIGEVVGGILLGPSLLGRISPQLQAALLPSDVLPFLYVIAQLGVVLYMFLIGLELDLDALRSRATSTIAISAAGILVPFTLGAGLAPMIFDAYAPPGVTRTLFVLFLGVSMSITAFPVLARILEDRDLHRTRLGIIALTCAAIDDVAAWCLLAFVVSVSNATPGRALITIALTAGYIGLMLTAGRRLMARFIATADSPSRMGEHGFTIVLVAVLMSAIATESIGVHAIFGAFLVGAIMPHDAAIAAQVRERISDLVRVMLLPAFFAFTGLRTQIGLLQTGQDWLVCGIIIAIATTGKLGGAAIAARMTGLSWRDSSALGILMNTRGLVELIVLNIGLDLGLVSPRLFTMLVIMALVTTIMTSPLLTTLTSRSASEAI
jgi:Kef-type K+ transport system membrane component KefB